MKEALIGTEVYIKEMKVNVIICKENEDLLRSVNYPCFKEYKVDKSKEATK